MPQSQFYESMLEEARDLFFRQGYHATSIREITSHVGSSEALVYRHFGSKEELFRKSVLAQFDEVLTRHGAEPVGDAPTEIGRLYDLFAANRTLFGSLIASSALVNDPARELTADGSPLRPVFDRLEQVFGPGLAARACVGFVMATSLFDNWLFDAQQPAPSRRRAVDQVSALMLFGCTDRPTDEPPSPRMPEPPPVQAVGAAPAQRVRVDPSKRQRRSRHEVRALVLSTARDMFAQYGYHGTTTKAIAERAGVAETSVYRHFGSKPELFESAIFDSFRGWIDAYLSRWGLTGRTRRSFELQTRDYIAGTYEMLTGNGALLRSALAGNAFEHETGRSPLHEIFVRLEYQLAEMAHENSLMGVDAVLVIRSTFGMLFSMAALPDWMFDGPGDQPARTRLIRELSSLMIYGVRA